MWKKNKPAQRQLYSYNSNSDSNNNNNEKNPTNIRHRRFIVARRWTHPDGLGPGLDGRVLQCVGRIVLSRNNNNIIIIVIIVIAIMLDSRREPQQTLWSAHVTRHG